LIHLAESKAALVRQLKERGVPVPKGAKVSDLQHRLKHWKGGKGYLMRLALTPKKDSLAAVLEQGKLYWVPNSTYAEQLAKTRVVYIVGMESEPPASVVALDVPIDF
jgi:hypothetical protein